MPLSGGALINCISLVTISRGYNVNTKIPNSGVITIPGKTFSFIIKVFSIMADF